MEKDTAKETSESEYYRAVCFRFQRQYNRSYLKCLELEKTISKIKQNQKTDMERVIKLLEEQRKKNRQLLSENNQLNINFSKVTEEKKLIDESMKKIQSENDEKISKLEIKIADLTDQIGDLKGADYANNQADVDFSLPENEEDDEEIPLLDIDIKPIYKEPEDKCQEVEDKKQVTDNKPVENSTTDNEYADESMENKNDSLTEIKENHLSFQLSDTVAESDNERPHIPENTNNLKLEKNRHVLQNFSNILFGLKLTKFSKMDKKQQFIKIRDEMNRLSFDAQRQKIIITAIEDENIDSRNIYELVCRNADISTLEENLFQTV